MTVNPGEVYHNPACREKVVIRTPAAHTNGERTIMDVYVEPGGLVAGYHSHPFSSERFTLVRGRLRVNVAGRDVILAKAGQTVLVPPGVPHRWFSDSADDETFMLCEFRNKAERFENLVLRQLFCLAQDGKTNAEGVPSLLQRAVTVLEFSDVIRYASPPWPAQRLLYGALAPIARLLGYKGCDPAYLERASLETAELEELPPEVAVHHLAS